MGVQKNLRETLAKAVESRQQGKRPINKSKGNTSLGALVEVAKAEGVLELRHQNSPIPVEQILGMYKLHLR